jgi:hypothetical protein
MILVANRVLQYHLDSLVERRVGDMNQKFYNDSACHDALRGLNSSTCVLQTSRSCFRLEYQARGCSEFTWALLCSE